MNEPTDETIVRTLAEACGIEIVAHVIGCCPQIKTTSGRDEWFAPLDSLTDVAIVRRVIRERGLGDAYVYELMHVIGTRNIFALIDAPARMQALAAFRCLQQKASE